MITVTARGTSVRIDVDAPHPVFVTVDPDRFRQVIGNLLTNALRATPPNGRVVLGVHLDDAQAVITVADTGSGIPAQDLPHVFDRSWSPTRGISGQAGATVTVGR